MEFAELVVKVTAEGIDKAIAALQGFTDASKDLSLTAEEVDAVYAGMINTFRGVNKEISTVTQTMNLMNKEMDATHAAALKMDKAIATSRKAEMDATHAYAKKLDTERTGLIKKAERDKRMEMDATHKYALRLDAERTADIKKKEAEKRAAMDATHKYALRLDRERTASLKKMWDDAAAKAKKEADEEIRQAKRVEAARKRVEARPFSLAAGRAFGAVGKGPITEVADQVDKFRTGVFDFLLTGGAAKAIGSLIGKYIIKPIEYAVGAAIEFERQWAIVMQTVTGSESMLAEVREDFKDLMASRPFDPEQITAATRALGELGVETSEIVKATDYILRFSIASGIATDEAATLLGQILATGGAARPTAQQIAELASAALAMGTNFAIGNKGVLTTMLRVSALIPTFHLSKEAALGLSTAMGSMGIKAERGTSALQLLFSMARGAEGNKLERFANIIGMTADETQRLIKEDIGAFTVKFIAGFEEMSAAGYNTDKMLQELGIRTIRSRQAIGQLAGGLPTLREAMSEANRVMGSTTDLMEQSDRQFQTTWALTKELGNSFWILAGSMTEGLLPGLKNLIIGLTDVINKMRELGDVDTTDFERFLAVMANQSVGGGFSLILKAFFDENKRKKEELANLAALRDLRGVGPLAPDVADLEDLFRLKQTEGVETAGVVIPLMSDKGAIDQQLKDQDEANKARDKKLKEMQADYDAAYKRSLDAAEEYNAKMATVSEMERMGVGDRAGRDKIRADALKDLVEAQERAAKNTPEAKALKDLQQDYESAFKSSMNAAQKYKAEMDRVAEMERKGVGTPEGRAQIRADAAKELADAQEKQAKAANKLSDAQKEANKYIEDAKTPMEKYYDLEKKLNALVESKSIPAKVRDILLERELKEAKEETNKERDKELEKQKKIEDELTEYAVSLNPVAELEEKIAKVREAMAKRPGIVTKQVGEEEIARLIREVKLPEEWEKTMRIVEGITERGMNAVADTMTDALWDGAKKGKEIMRDFAKDITNILLEELAFKPISESIIDMVKKDQVAKYLGSIKEGMPGQTTPGTESAEELTKAANETTKSFADLGKGSLQLLLDLTQGIGGFLAGLLGGSGGGGFDWGEFFLRAGIGGLTSGAAAYGKTLLSSTSVNEFDQTFTGPGASDLPGYVTGSYASTSYAAPSRSSMMDYSANNATTSSTRGQAPPVNITMTALDPRTAASTIMANMPVIERGMQRAYDRGSAYAKTHRGRR